MYLWITSRGLWSQRLIRAKEEPCASQIRAHMREMDFHLFEERLDALALRGLPHRTLARDPLKAVLLGKFPDRLLRNVNERPDDRDAVLHHRHFRQIRSKLALVKEIHEECLRAVIAMMTECHRRRAL